MPVNKNKRSAQRLQNKNKQSQDSHDIERSKDRDTIKSALCPKGIAGESESWQIGAVIPLQNKQYHMTLFGKVIKI